MPCVGGALALGNQHSAAHLKASAPIKTGVAQIAGGVDEGPSLSLHVPTQELHALNLGDSTMVNDARCLKRGAPTCKFCGFHSYLRGLPPCVPNVGNTHKRGDLSGAAPKPGIPVNPAHSWPFLHEPPTGSTHEAKVASPTGVQPAPIFITSHSSHAYAQVHNAEVTSCPLTLIQFGSLLFPLHEDGAVIFVPIVAPWRSFHSSQTTFASAPTVCHSVAKPPCIPHGATTMPSTETLLEEVELGVGIYQSSKQLLIAPQPGSTSQSSTEADEHRIISDFLGVLNEDATIGALFQEVHAPTEATCLSAYNAHTQTDGKAESPIVSRAVESEALSIEASGGNASQALATVVDESLPEEVHATSEFLSYEVHAVKAPQHSEFVAFPREAPADTFSALLPETLEGKTESQPSQFKALINDEALNAALSVASLITALGKVLLAAATFLTILRNVEIETALLTKVSTEASALKEDAIDISSMSSANSAEHGGSATAALSKVAPNLQDKGRGMHGPMDVDAPAACVFGDHTEVEIIQTFHAKPSEAAPDTTAVTVPTKEPTSRLHMALDAVCLSTSVEGPLLHPLHYLSNDAATLLTLNVHVVNMHITVAFTIKATHFYFLVSYALTSAPHMDMLFPRLRGRNGYHQAQQSNAHGRKDEDAERGNSTSTKFKACATIEMDLLFFYLKKDVLDPG